MHPALPLQPIENPANLVYTLPSIVEPLDLERLFPTRQPLEVELGSGDGSFLLGCAHDTPEHNFIGVERLLGRIRKLDRKGRRLGLTNLRGVRIECAYFLQYLLPPDSADALHVYFPDPWPKKRHRKYRLINEGFPLLAERVLKPSGCIHLRTDDTEYFEQMREVFRNAPGFEAVTTPETLVVRLTDFERDFQAEGRVTHRASYRLREESSDPQIR